MSENLPEGAKCSWCSEELDEEERETPQMAGDDPICDDCYHEENDFTCCFCEEYDEKDIQHEMIAVFVPTSDGHGGKLQPGVYLITGGPYWGTDYFSSWLCKDKLVFLCSIPESLGNNDLGYACGHFCRSCQAEMHDRGATELTRKCAMAFC